MKAKKSYIFTTKEAPNEAELISHKLMLRAGLIKKLASGIYTWTPLGLKTLRKVEHIVREEMNNIGAQEILMPSIQPSELWQESGRWEFYGKELLRIKDRHDRDFCYGPTHEEVAVDLIRKDVKSYKQLPLCVYQIQTKFRDEVRPRFGVMRAREFIMKDAYSFHTNYESLKQTYDAMYNAYTNILTRLGLIFRPVAADTGSIGGTGSHEFQVLADCGEDIIAYSDEDIEYAANIELAKHKPEQTIRPNPAKYIAEIATPTQKTCEEVAQLLNVPLKTTVKTLVFEGETDKAVLILIRGDHELNEIKLAKHKLLKQPLTFVNHEVINEVFGCNPGFLGPVGFKGPIIADLDVSVMSDFICGANKDGYHLNNVNFGRDCDYSETIDLRNVVNGDTTPSGKGKIKLCRGIEVGHVFQLRTKYSSAMNLTYLDQNGKSQLIEMGCYGIGVSRIVAAAIEQHNDERGIIFPINMAPFELVITPINYAKCALVKEVSDKLYQVALSSHMDTLLDDRDERLGSMLADSELLGIPYRIVIGEKTLANNQVELYTRSTQETLLVNVDEVLDKVSALISQERISQKNSLTTQNIIQS